MTAAALIMSLSVSLALVALTGYLVRAVIKRGDSRIDAAQELADVAIRFEREVGLRIDAEAELDDVGRRSLQDRVAHERQLEILNDEIERLRVEFDSLDVPGSVRSAFVRLIEAAQPRSDVPLVVVGGTGEAPE